ncbi:hypothetical protein E5Q_00173 [Mixia osmundae IAM 14324]|uniref:Uncharacterized protein n=1 Tax=Mixia osmundae (strain CBS 9802 / IAM 14324 / JCM 22182 / KY 12970) TaxID=764103 RepID=G7DSH1_MIXOS|nr:hypothetical protein E5Q_00173 [Mixia osmundae IAM 14324]
MVNDPFFQAPSSRGSARGRGASRGRGRGANSSSSSSSRGGTLKRSHGSSFGSDDRSPAGSRGRGTAPSRSTRGNRGRGAARQTNGDVRSASNGNTNGVKRARTRKVEEDDEEADGGSEDDGPGALYDSDVASDDDAKIDEVAEEEERQDEARESAAAKRLRLAREYLARLEEDRERELAPDAFDAAVMDRDTIADRLQKDVMAESGRMHHHLASRTKSAPSRILTTPRKAHRLSVVGATISEDGQHLYTASTDGRVLQWSTNTNEPESKLALESTFSGGAKSAKAKGKAKASDSPASIQGHTGELYAMALSSNGKYLVTVGKDRMIGVWDTSAEGSKWRAGLKGHKDAISDASFRRGTTILLTSSYDRTVKLHEISTLSYVETLFGHQDKIHSLAALRSELAVTSGGRDKTVRYWKIADESQLVFRAGVANKLRSVIEGVAADEAEEEELALKRKRDKAQYLEGSTDCVAMIDDTTFLSGGDSGTICLWNTTKKKPIFSHALAHGLHEHESASEGKITSPRWITALGCLPYGDVFASGSWDGSIRLWSVHSSVKSFAAMFEIPAVGFVNSIQLVLHESEEVARKISLAASLGQEHRLGRWLKLKHAKNVALYADLPIA